MKNFLLILLVLCMFFPFEKVFTQNRVFGLGISIGEPTGVNSKLWTSSTTAFDFGLGWSIGGDRLGGYYNQYNGNRRIHFHFDYLFHLFDAIGSTGQYPVYYGIGGRFNTGGGYNNSLAVRFVAGLAWMPHESQFDTFIEFVPSIQLTTKPLFAIDSALGVRYYF